MAQAAEYLPSKCEALSSNPSNAREEKSKQNKNPSKGISLLTS
jgi:hypothetical protein